MVLQLLLNQILANEFMIDRSYKMVNIITIIILLHNNNMQEVCWPLVRCFLEIVL